MSETCPYCGAELADVAYLGRHAMESHREAVRAHWVGEGYISPFVTGQQTVSGVGV
jgi:hypothetical protein